MTIAIVLLSLLHLRFGEWQDISASESGNTSPGSSQRKVAGHLRFGEWLGEGQAGVAREEIRSPPGSLRQTEQQKWTVVVPHCGLARQQPL